MNQDLLEEIKKAEKDANRIVENAEKRKNEIILESGRDARSLEEKEMERLKKEAEQQIRLYEAKIGKELERFLGEKRLETDKMKKASSKKVERAVEILKKEFHDFLGE
jgi:V/A-type H+-transporting ATPase subunit G/H